MRQPQLPLSYVNAWNQHTKAAAAAAALQTPGRIIPPHVLRSSPPPHRILTPRRRHAARRTSPSASAKLGMPACAITDHGNMFGAVEFYNAMKKEGVKPIIGCEMYVAYGSRFDKAGVEDGQADAGANNHLIVLGAERRRLQEPRQARQRRVHRGLLLQAADRQGAAARASRGADRPLVVPQGRGLAERWPAGNWQKAKDAALAYREILGPENFFLEIQDHGIPDQQKIVPMMARLGRGGRPTAGRHERLALPRQVGRVRARGAALHRHRQDARRREADEVLLGRLLREGCRTRCAASSRTIPRRRTTRCASPSASTCRST